MKKAGLLVTLIIALAVASAVVGMATKEVNTGAPVDHVVPGKTTGAGRNSLLSADQ